MPTEEWEMILDFQDPDKSEVLGAIDEYSAREDLHNKNVRTELLWRKYEEVWRGRVWRSDVEKPPRWY